MTRSLYNSDDVHINELLRDAHPEGSVTVIEDPSKEGVFEDSIEAQMRTLKMVYKQPMVAVVASLADKLEALGASDLSSAIDKIAYDFHFEPMLFKKIAVRLDSIISFKYKTMIQILSTYMSEPRGAEAFSKLQAMYRAKRLIDTRNGEIFSNKLEWHIKSLTEARNRFIAGTAVNIDDPELKKSVFKEDLAKTIKFLNGWYGGLYNIDFVIRETGMFEFNNTKKIGEIKEWAPYFETLKATIGKLENISAEDDFTMPTGNAEHDKTSPNADGEELDMQVGDPTISSNFTLQFNNMKSKIDSIQATADGMAALGVSEKEVDDVLRKYLNAIAAFKKMYMYNESNKGNIPVGLRSKVLDMLKNTDAALDSLQRELEGLN